MLLLVVWSLSTRLHGARSQKTVIFILTAALWEPEISPIWVHFTIHVFVTLRLSTIHNAFICATNQTPFRAQVVITPASQEQVTRSNLGSESAYPDWGILWFSSVPPGKFPDSSLNYATTAFFHVLSNALLCVLCTMCMKWTHIGLVMSVCLSVHLSVCMI
jgi:hypothetical protein